MVAHKSKLQVFLEAEKKAGRSMRQFAKKARVDVATVSRAARKLGISARSAVKIAKAAGLDVTDILQMEMFE